MTSEAKKGVGGGAGCLLVSALCVAFLVGGYLILDYLVAARYAREQIESADYEFHYGQCYFKRLNQDDKFSIASLTAGVYGPWLWMSETEGVKIDRNTAEESGKRIAKQLGLDEPRLGTYEIFISGDTDWSLMWQKAISQARGDVYINSRGDDLPLAISMTKNGPRISLRCTEEELRKAFGEPTKILRPAPYRHPGV